MAATQVKGAQILDGTITDADVASANKDGSAGTPSMRTLGTGSAQAAAGNDDRFDTMHICNCRISPSTSSATASSSPVSSLYLHPYKGTRMALYDTSNSVWVVRSMPATYGTITIPNTKYRLFDMFAYWDSGTSSIKVETVNWNQPYSGSVTGATNATPIVVSQADYNLTDTSWVGLMVGFTTLGGNTALNNNIWTITAVSTVNETITLGGSVGNGAYTSGGNWFIIDNTRATALALQNGVLVKSGDASRRYIGTAMTDYDGTIPVGYNGKFFLWNLYNRVQNVNTVIETTDTWTYSTATWRLANRNIANRIQTVTGTDFNNLTSTLLNRYRVLTSAWNTGGNKVAVAINRDDITPSSIGGVSHLFGTGASGGWSAMVAEYYGEGLAGYHYYAWLENSQAAGTTTWGGDAGTPELQTHGIEGMVWF